MWAALQNEDASRHSNLSRDSEGQSLGSIHTGVSGDTGSLPSSLVAYNDWEIAPMDIEIMRREDGSPWELGAGAFGKVRRKRPLRMHARMQPGGCVTPWGSLRGQACWLDPSKRL